MKRTLVLLLCMLMMTSALPALADSDLDFRYALNVENFTEDGLAVFHARNGLYGFVNTEGDVVIAPQYVSAGSFGNGLAPVSVGELCGYIDTTGELAIPCQWTAVRSFTEGLAAVRDDSGKWGYIDPTGTLVIPCQFKYDYAFQGGMAYVGNDGYIDRAGNPVDPNALSPAAAIFTFEEDPDAYNPTYHIYCNGAFALTVKGTNKYFSLSYTDIKPVQGAENLWVICQMYLYNAATNQVLMRDMQYVSDVCSEGMILVRREDESYFADVNGRMVIAPVNYAHDFSCGYALVERDAVVYDQEGYPLDVYTYVDTAGNLSYYEFDRAYSFVNGYAIVKDDGQWQVFSAGDADYDGPEGG